MWCQKKILEISRNICSLQFYFKVLVPLSSDGEGFTEQ